MTRQPDTENEDRGETGQYGHDIETAGSVGDVVGKGSADEAVLVNIRIRNGRKNKYLAPLRIGTRLQAKYVLMPYVMAAVTI